MLKLFAELPQQRSYREKVDYLFRNLKVRSRLIKFMTCPITSGCKLDSIFTEQYTVGNQ